MSNRPENQFLISGDSVGGVTLCSGGRLMISNWIYRDVSYGEWIIYCNALPGGQIGHQGKWYRMNPGEAVLIPPYTGFSTQSSGTFDHFFLHFIAPEPFDRVKRQLFFFPVTEQLGSLIALSGKCQSSWRKSFYLKLAAASVLAQLPESAFLADQQEVMDSRIKHAVKILEDEFARNPDNPKLARRVGMSLNNFYTLFREETGTTPKHYLLNLKLEQSRRELLYSHKTITGIALDCGFADRYCFSKAFKKFYGFSPAEYRDKHHPGK